MNLIKIYMYIFLIYFLIFLSNWDCAPLGVGALCKLLTLRIGSGGTPPQPPEILNCVCFTMKHKLIVTDSLT